MSTNRHTRAPKKASRERALLGRLYRSSHELFERMIAGIAHDLRSPLSSMTFNVGVLRRRWRELDDQEIDALLAEIAACCTWQQQAINGMVETSRMSERMPVRLVEMLQRLDSMLRPMFRQRNAELILDIDRALIVVATPVALEHIFTNLLSNAVYHSKEGSHVRVSSRTTDARTVSILVEDDGPGVPRENWVRIFDPFFTTRMGGTGLGLCLAREAALASGGDLLLVERDPPGACFEVKLPLSASLEVRP